MTEIQVVGCKDLEELACNLNNEMESGKAITFHNNSGIFVKYPDKNLVCVFYWEQFRVPETASAEIRKANSFGAVFDKLIVWEPDFFRSAAKGELSGYNDRASQAPEGSIIYGSKSAIFGVRMTGWLSCEFDSPEYGPCACQFKKKELPGLWTIDHITRYFLEKSLSR
jgi:hypothetical protein